MLSVSITVTHAQQIDNDNSLGDVAREQRAIHKRTAERINFATDYGTQNGLRPRNAVALRCQNSQQSVLVPTSGQEQPVPGPTSQAEAGQSSEHVREGREAHPGSALDGPKDSDTDTMVVKTGSDQSGRG